MSLQNKTNNSKLQHQIHHVLRFMFYLSPLLCAIVLAHDAIWFSDVYRRPSIKTVYEPMPDDRPRCSRVWIMGLLSLFLLRTPSSRDRLCLLGYRISSAFLCPRYGKVSLVKSCFPRLSSLLQQQFCNIRLWRPAVSYTAAAKAMELEFWILIINSQVDNVDLETEHSGENSPVWHRRGKRNVKGNSALPLF